MGLPIHAKTFKGDLPDRLNTTTLSFKIISIKIPGTDELYRGFKFKLFCYSEITLITSSLSFVFTFTKYIPGVRSETEL